MHRRLACDVNMNEEQELDELVPARLTCGHSSGTGRQVVMLQPMTDELRTTIPMYTGPMHLISVTTNVHGEQDHQRGASQATAVGRQPGESMQLQQVAMRAMGDGQSPIVQGSGGPMHARKSKRMQRRLTHWQCIYCRHETRNDAAASKCGKCGGDKAQLRDADSEARENARCGARAKEYKGRQLNGRAVGTQNVPRAAQGVFERARFEAMVQWEVDELEKYTGAQSYLEKEDCMLGVMESFYVVHSGARVSIMDATKRMQLRAADVAHFFNTVGRRTASSVRGEDTFPMGGYFNEFRREGVTATLMLELRDIVRKAIAESGGDVPSITRNATTFAAWYNDRHKASVP